MNVFAYEIEIPGDQNGDPLTFYAATRAFETSASDTPANTMFRALVGDPGGVSLQVFGSGRSAGLVQPTWGSTTFIHGREGGLGIFRNWPDFDANGGKVTCRYGAPGAAYPADWETVFVAYIDGAPLVNAKRMQLNYRGRERAFEKLVVTDGFDGSGGIEGTGVAGSRLRQLVLGRPGFVQPILLQVIGDVDNIWFVAANAPADWSDLENGATSPLYVPHDGGIPRQANGLFATEGDVFSEEVDAGQYMHWAGADGEGPVLVRLGSRVDFDMRYSFDGAIVDDPGVSAPRAWTIFDLAIRAGITDADPDDLPAGTVNFEAGNRIVETETYKDVFNDVAAFEVASIGFNQVDEFVARRIEQPGSSVYTFTDGQNSRDWDVAPLPGMERRVHEVSVSAGRTTSAPLAPAVADKSYLTALNDDGTPVFTEDQKDDITAARAQLVRDPWLTNFTASSDNVLDADSGAERFELQIVGNEFAAGEATMLAWAERFMTVHGAKHFPLRLEADVNADTLALRLLDGVTAISDDYGTRVGVIVAINQQLKRRKIIFTILCLQDIPSDVAVVRDDSNADAGGNGAGSGGTGVGANQAAQSHFVDYSFAVTDPAATDPIPTTDELASWRSPFDWTITAPSFYADLRTPQATGATAFQPDVKLNGTTIFSTRPTIENTEDSSATAATPPAFSTLVVAQGDLLTFHVHQQGDETARGLTVHMSGVRS